MFDPFSTLGLGQTFDLQPAAIQRAYLARVASLDPTDESAVEPLNTAKAALMNPEERAGALLALRGGPSKESDRSLPTGFLPQIMETREEIEAALAGGDPAQRARWRAWAREQRDAYTRRVSSLFAAGSDPATLKSIRTELNAWRYIERLIEQLEDPAHPV